MVPEELPEAERARPLEPPRPPERVPDPVPESLADSALRRRGAWPADADRRVRMADAAAATGATTGAP